MAFGPNSSGVSLYSEQENNVSHRHAPTASKLLRSSLQLPENWWEKHAMRKDVCDEICNQIMDLYD